LGVSPSQQLLAVNKVCQLSKKKNSEWFSACFWYSSDKDSKRLGLLVAREMWYNLSLALCLYS
jgi:hypothetical protein